MAVLLKGAIYFNDFPQYSFDLNEIWLAFFRVKMVNDGKELWDSQASFPTTRKKTERQQYKITDVFILV